MSRPASGQVLERKTQAGKTYALRFRALGQRRYVTLGTDADGWSRHRAEEELRNVLAAVRLGVWEPPAEPVEPVAEVEEPTFHEYSSDWLAQREAEGLKTKSITDLRWSLVNHLLPFFAKHRLSEITPREVKRYTQAKLAERATIEEARAAAAKKGERFPERPLSNGSINHTLRHLAQVLESAVDDELIPSNPASGGRRRLKADKPARPWVEPEQLMALLDAAAGTGQLLLSLLAGAGLRIGEALALRWQDVDLGVGSLFVVEAKTAKGRREVHLTPALREALILARAEREPKPGEYVIATSSGRKHNPSNLRRDVLAPAVETANAKLAEVGIAPIGRVTFHSLRRTYASLRCACGDDVRYAADQLGHEDPRFTLRVYAQATKRRERLAKPQRDAYDNALDWARMGTADDLSVPESVAAAVS